MRVGCLGGSFDPIHVGHLALAEACREAKALDLVLFVVAAAPPHKLSRALAPGADRLALARLAVADHPAFAVDARETTRRGPSYTIDTVREMRAERPLDELFWLIGADTLPELPSWRHAEVLLDLVTFVTAFRPGHDVEADLRALALRIGPEHVKCLRDNVAPMPLFGVSSTDVRNRVRAGRSIRYLVPDTVREHIERAGLYRAGGPASSSPSP